MHPTKPGTYSCSPENVVTRKLDLATGYQRYRRAHDVDRSRAAPPGHRARRARRPRARRGVSARRNGPVPARAPVAAASSRRRSRPTRTRRVASSPDAVGVMVDDELMTMPIYRGDWVSSRAVHIDGVDVGAPQRAPDRGRARRCSTPRSCARSSCSPTSPRRCRRTASTPTYPPSAASSGRSTRRGSSVRWRRPGSSSGGG